MDLTSNKKYTAETWDIMQYFFEPYHDHQMHGIIYFENILNIEILKKAVFHTMEIVPTLKSRYVEGRIHAYWEEIQIDIDNIVTLKTADNLELEIDGAITKKTDELKGPQLKITIVRCDGRDTLCIVLNHMICDGAGFKEYLYLLSSIYSDLNKNITSDYSHLTGTRNSNQILKNFSFKDKFKIFKLENDNSKNSNNIKFPYSNNEEKLYIFKHVIPQNRFFKIKEYGKQNTVTINDIIMAAYYRALYKLLNLNPDQSLIIPCMVDLRRYLPDKKAYAICNLASMEVCNVNADINLSFLETVKEISTYMTAKKAGFMGLNGISILNTVFKFTPYFMLKKLIKKHFKNPLIAITNIGIISDARLVFDGIKIKDAFVTGAIKHPPYFQLALSSYNDSITFTINFFGTEYDAGLISKLYDLIDIELNNV